MSILALQFSFGVQGYPPGSRCAPASLTLTAQDGAQTVNCQQMNPGQQLSGISCLYVDNSTGAVGLVITFPDTGMQVDVAPFTQGFFPVMTSGLVFNVAAPLVGVLGGASVTPTIQVLNFPVPPQPSETSLPDLNAGTVQSIGPITSTPFPFSVAGAGLIYSSLELDNSAYPSPVTIASTDIDGHAWSVTIPGFTRSEVAIPPTTAGTAGAATSSTSVGKTVTARWRVALSGEGSSTSLPSNFTIENGSFASLSGGTDLASLTGFTSLGYYVRSVSVFAVGVTQPFNVTLEDSTNGNAVFWTAAFGSGLLYPVTAMPVGYTSYARTGGLRVAVLAAAAIATCELVVQVELAPVNASQTG